MEKDLKGGSLSKLSLELLRQLEANGNSDESITLDGEFAERLKIMLGENKNYLQDLQNQDIKGIMRQMLNLNQDWLMSKESLDNAREKGVISGDLYESLKVDKSFEDATASHEGKREIIEDAILSTSTLGSLFFRIKNALDVFNTVNDDKLAKRNRTFNQVEFAFPLKDLPEHRRQELVFRAIAYELSTKTETNEIEVVGPGDKLWEEKKLGVKTSIAYDTKKGLCAVNLQAVQGKGTKDEKSMPGYSIVIDIDKTLENIEEQIRKQYLIKSSVIKEDFADEAELISTLYTKPLQALLARQTDEDIAKSIALIEEKMSEVRKAFNDENKKLHMSNKQSLLFKAWLSIVDSGNTPLRGKNEKVFKISKVELVEKYFNNDHTAYDYTISESTPTQCPLERSVWLFRMDFGTVEKPNKVDFVLLKYGATREPIWVPVDKDCIVPTQLAAQFTRSVIKNRKQFTKGVSKQAPRVNFMTGSTERKTF